MLGAVAYLQIVVTAGGAVESFDMDRDHTPVDALIMATTTSAAADSGYIAEGPIFVVTPPPTEHRSLSDTLILLYTVPTQLICGDFKEKQAEEQGGPSTKSVEK